MMAGTKRREILSAQRSTGDLAASASSTSAIIWDRVVSAPMRVTSTVRGRRWRRCRPSPRRPASWRQAGPRRTAGFRPPAPRRRQPARRRGCARRGEPRRGPPPPALPSATRVSRPSGVCTRAFFGSRPYSRAIAPVASCRAPASMCLPTRTSAISMSAVSK